VNQHLSGAAAFLSQIDHSVLNFAAWDAITLAACNSASCCYWLLLQANTFTLAGYETTANALAFALWCISTHPEAEAALLQEAAAAMQPFHTYSRDLEQQVTHTCSQL
jgi:hypothetical protein